MTSSALMLPPQRNEIPPPKNRPILVLNFNFNNCTSTFSRYSPGFFPWHLFFFSFCFSFLFFSGMWSINLSSLSCFSAPQGRRNSPQNIGHFGSLRVRSGRCCVELHHGTVLRMLSIHKVTQETGSELVLRNSPTVQFDTTPNCFHAPAP